MTEWRSLNVPGSWVREEEWIGVTPTVTWTQYQPVVMNRAEHVSNAVNMLVNLHQHPHLWSRASCSDSKNKAADASGWKVRYYVIKCHCHLPVGSLFKKELSHHGCHVPQSGHSFHLSSSSVCGCDYLLTNLWKPRRGTHVSHQQYNTIINPGFHYRLLTHPDLLVLCWLN